MRACGKLRVNDRDSVLKNLRLAFISASKDNPFVPAHETVHILFGTAIGTTGDHHEPNEPWNLMHGKETASGDDNTVTAPKRLRDDQINRMRSNGSKYLQ